MSLLPLSHTHALSNFKASSNTENPSSSNPPSEDALSEIPLKPLNALLREREVIDPSGIILHPEKLPSFPTLDKLDQDALRGILNETVTVKSDGKEMKISLNEILLRVYTQYPALVPKIDIVGGFARKFLLSSPCLVSAFLTALTGFSPDELKPYVNQIVAETKKQQLPDIDIRINSSINQRDTLGFFTTSLVDYFSYKLQCSRNKAKKCAFTKFNLVYDEKNQFSIATITPQDSFEFELLFVGSLCRSHLFTHDSIRLTILPFLLGKGPVAIESDYGHPWQPIVDLLTKTVHVFHPESVDLFGFPRLMSFFSRGHRPSKPTDVIQLSSKATQLSQYHVGVPEQVASLLKTTWKNHHQQDPVEALTLTINACLHLNISAQDHKKIWKLMREEHWQAVDLSHIPLLSMIDKAVIEHHIPFNVLSAALSIFWSGEDGRISIEGTESFLFTFLNPIEAIEQLSAHLLECPKLEGLSPLIHAGNSTKSASMTADVQKKGTALLRSKTRSQRFFGFMLVATFGNENNASLLLEHFLNVLNFLPPSQRPTFLERLKKVPVLSEEIAKFGKVYLSELNESQQLELWIEILASNSDYAVTASLLWIRYRKKYPVKKRERLDEIVVDHLLPKHWEEAIKVFEAGQDTAHPRLNSLAALLPYINCLSDAQFQTIAPKMCGLLSSTLSLVDFKISNINKDSAFTGPFANFFVRLLNSGNRDQAYELLELAAKHPLLKASDPHLYRCRLVFMEQNDLSSKHMYGEWKKLNALGAGPADQTALYLKVHLKAIKQLTEDGNFINQGFQLLRIHSEASLSDPNLRPFILKDITHLAACQDESSAAKLIDTVYRKHLTPELLASHRHFLFNSFLSRNEVEKAYKLWQTIKECYPETTKILVDKLTEDKEAKKNIKAALRLLRNEISDEQLSPDDKFDYFLKIQTFTRSTKLLATPEEEAEALLAFQDTILSLPQPESLTERAAVIAAASKVSPETSVALLRKFPPAVFTAWELLIEACPNKSFPLVWENFYAWLEEAPSTDSTARRVVFKALNRFHELNASVAPKLFETLDSPESPLGRLSKSAAECMKMKGKLIASCAKSAKGVEAIAALFDPLESEVREDSLSAYSDLTLELAAVCLQKKGSTFTNYACKIFSRCISLLTESKSAMYSEQITDTLVLLLKTLNSVPKAPSEDQISLLVYSSSALREKFPDCLPAVKIANAMSSLNSSFIIDECVALLECSDVCPAFNEAWGRLLPILMESTLHKKQPDSESAALKQYETHQHKLTKGSKAFYRCSDLVLDIGIRNLDNRATLFEFSKLIPSHLKKVVDQQDAFLVVFEMPLKPFFSPVFYLQPQASEAAKRIFYNRMSTILSKVLETSNRCDEIEGFVHHFMTKNLIALCDNFPEKKDELIPLLDKYYYRYSPSMSLFYFAHVEFAMKLLNHALSKGIYAHPHVKEIYEASLFFEKKPINPSGITKEQQTKIIERVINRYIAAQTPYTVVKAIQILQRTQHKVLNSNLKVVESIYGKLIEAAMLNPFYTSEQFTLFEWVRRGIMQENSPVIGYSSSEAGKNTASNLCEMLFDRVLELSRTPTDLGEKPIATEIYLLDWISKVLILSQKHRGFNDLKGPERYFQLVNKLLPRITGLFDLMDDTQKEMIGSQMTRVIIGEDVWSTPKLSNSCKKIRSALMRQWLLGISQEPKSCAEQFKTAKKHQVFEKTPKDAAKVASILKSIQ